MPPELDHDQHPTHPTEQREEPAARELDLHSILANTGTDPVAIAARLISLKRGGDAKLWSEIHQELGNAKATQIREAMTRQPAAAQPEGAVATAGESQSNDGDTLSATVERNVLGVILNAPAGVRVSALEECTRIITAEIGNNEYAQKHFAMSKVSIVIIPAHMAMTDVPAFASMKGGKTFDGRDWATVRGSGGTPTRDGRFSIGVAEEDTVPVKGVPSYPVTYSVGMHELAHALESKGMTRTQQARVKQLYAAHDAKDHGDTNDTWTDKYGSENEQEYFAQATNSFFGRNTMGANHNGREWLAKTDPDMYAFLVELYEGHHDKDGALR